MPLSPNDAGLWYYHVRSINDSLPAGARAQKSVGPALSRVADGAQHPRRLGDQIDLVVERDDAGVHGADPHRKQIRRPVRNDNFSRIRADVSKVIFQGFEVLLRIVFKTGLRI